MNTIYLRGTDEADVLSALRDCGLTVTVDGVEQPTMDPYKATVVMIGPYYRPTGRMLTNADGEQYEERELVPGFHANVRVPDPDRDITPLDRIRVYPDTPGLVIV